MCEQHAGSNTCTRTATDTQAGNCRQQSVTTDIRVYEEYRGFRLSRTRKQFKSVSFSERKGHFGMSNGKLDDSQLRK